MSGNLNQSLFPNPDTYLNHLDPDEAPRYEAARNIYVALLGAAIWDVLVYIPDDIRILRKRITLVTLCFAFTRVFSIALIFLYVILHTGPVANCDAMELAVGITCLLCTACSSFLFLRRVQAVYSGNPVVHWVFFFLWFVISAIAVTVPIGTRMFHIEGTQYCAVYQVKSYVSVTEFLPAVFDTLVFFAISYKVASSQSSLDAGISWDSLVSGKALPRMSRAVLQGGQQYYLIVFGVNLLAGVFLYTTSIPSTYRTMFALPSVALTATMACRVFRNLRQFDSDSQSMTLPATLSDISFANNVSAEKVLATNATKDLHSSTVVSRGSTRTSMSVDGDGDGVARAIELRPDFESERSSQTMEK